MDYITIIQGDDTNFLDDQFIVVNFDTDLDLSGFTATFTLGDVTLTYGNLSNKTFEIVLSNEITSNLVIGKQYGELKLLDPQNRIRTITSIIPFIVKKGVNEDITFVKNSLHVSMNVYDTTIDIYVETSGISKTEASRLLTACNDAKQAAQSYSNTAQNSLIDINKSISDFNNSLTDLNALIDNATEQANITIQKATEVDTLLENASDSDLSKLSSIGFDKINQTKALETGNISNDPVIYNKILEYKQNCVSTGVDVLEENYTLHGNVVTIENGITKNLNGDYVSVNKTFPSERTNLEIHVEAILDEDFGSSESYFFATNESGIIIQSQSRNTIYMGFYASDYSIKMMETGTLNLNPGDRLILDAIVNDSSVSITASCNGQNVSASEELGTGLWFRTAITGFRYGRYLSSYGTTCYAEIDLTKSYVKIGNETIRPIFCIPYTLSKTGSKIADAGSRKNIQEIYEKEGFANYYTLDEENENFTLPMGEVYGMINKTVAPLLENRLNDDIVKQLLNSIAPDMNVPVIVNTTLTSASTAYKPNCAGWYYLSANVSAKRFLYINDIKSPFCLPTGDHSISVFLAKNDSIYWDGAIGTIHSQKFIPARGWKYEKTNSEQLDDLFS